MASHGRIEVTSPWDGRVVGEVPEHDAVHVEEQVGVAQAAVASPLAQHERAAILDRAAALVGERADTLATCIRDEAGKPISLARVEVERAVDTLRFSAVEARTLAGDVIPMDGTASGAGRIAFTTRVPRGVVGAISPFNFPLNLCCHKIGPAVAAGCPVVHKPASTTPLTAQHLHRILLDAGLPEEHYRLVFGGGSTVGGAIVADQRVRHITFTGSSEVGWGLRAQAPRAEVALELGNATPLLVFADSDLDAVAAAVARHGYGFAGQSCIAVQRVLVERSAYDEAVERITAAAGAVAFGDPAFDEVTCGPVIDGDARARVLAWMADARAGGARITVGGGHDGNVIEPTVIADATPRMQVACDELFGPAVVLQPFSGEEEALALANGTPYGLQAGIYTNDIRRAMRVARQLDFGGVTVNEAPTFRADQQPYGGVKDSGNTREGPHYAVRAMTEERLVVLGS